MQPHGAPGTRPTQPSPCAEGSPRQRHSGARRDLVSARHLPSSWCRQSLPVTTYFMFRFSQWGRGLHVTEGIRRPRQHHSLAQDHIASCCQNRDGAAVGLASPFAPHHLVSRMWDLTYHSATGTTSPCLTLQEAQLQDSVTQA